MLETEIKRLKMLNPIVEIAAELGLKVRNNLSFCFREQRHIGEDEPTLFFNISRNTFFCKTCEDVGGDVVDFICQFKGWEPQQAIKWLVHRIEFDYETRQKYYMRGKKKG
jgi:hypothetical protein